MKSNTMWITRTAMFTALLIAMQAVTAPLGNTLVTGTIVNLILVVSVIMCGLSSGCAVALISPVCAKLIGIGPFWTLIPFIMAGNLSLVLIWHFIGNLGALKNYAYYVAAIIAACVKFVVLYVGVAKVAVPLILQLPEPQATVISNVFSLPQLFTAAAGGLIAAVLLPVLLKAVKKTID